MTWGGQHSVHELSDLLNAYSWQLSCIAQAVAAAEGEQWGQGSEANAVSDWSVAYAHADTDYEPAKLRAQALIAATAKDTTYLVWAGWDSQPSTDSQGDVFDALAGAFHPYVGLFGQLSLPVMRFPADVMAQLKAQLAKTPQPTAPDFDLSNYQIADNAQQAIEQTAKKAGASLWDRVPWWAPPALAVGAGLWVVSSVKGIFR